MVVLGNPGSGKTTLLKYLAWGLAGSQTRRNFPPTGFHFFFP